MTGSDIALIITSIGSLVAAVTSSISVIISAWSARKLIPVVDQVQKIEVATNSMKDALVAATAKAEHAAGVVAGRAEVTAEIKGEKPA